MHSPIRITLDVLLGLINSNCFRTGAWMSKTYPAVHVGDSVTIHHTTIRDVP